MTLFVFHFDISGKDDKDIQLENKPFISLILLVFHIDISGKDDKILLLENKLFIF